MGDKRPGTDAAEEVVERIEDSVGGYHITDGACDSVFQPCLSMTRDMKVSLALIARPDLHPDLHPICPGAPKRPRCEADAVQRLARRIRTFAEGKFVPSPQPNVLNKLTDALLVTADAVVKSVAAEAPPLSGNSAFRLLARTVADARGAQTVIDKPLALTVGKRLQVQAQRVRDDATSYCRPIKERASQERQELLDGLMLNRDGEAALEAAMAASRARELSELQRAKEDEVYTGFLELESLLPEEQRWDEASPAERVAALEGADEPSPRSKQVPLAVPLTLIQGRRRKSISSRSASTSHGSFPRPTGSGRTAPSRQTSPRLWEMRSRRVSSSAWTGSVTADVMSFAATSARSGGTWACRPTSKYSSTRNGGQRSGTQRMLRSPTRVPLPPSRASRQSAADLEVAEDELEELRV